MKRIIIIGAGGHGREMAQLIKDINRIHPETWELLGFLDSNPALAGTITNGYPILTNEQFQSYYDDRAPLFVICGIGGSALRCRIVERLQREHPRLLYATLVHPTAVIGDEVAIGEGTMICAHTVITTNITIESHVLVNYGTTIGHDCVVESFSSLLPGTHLSGNVIVSEQATLGTGSSVIPGIRIGKGAMIGAAAAVIRDIPDYCTAVGVPAKIIKNNQDVK